MTVVDRQPQVAMEASFVSAVKISVGYSKLWANRGVLLKALKWVFRGNASLLFRSQFDLRKACAVCAF